MIDCDHISRAFNVSLPMQEGNYTRYVVDTTNEKATTEFSSFLLDMLSKADDVATDEGLTFDICERNGNDLKSSTIDVWMHVAETTNGMIVNMGNRIELTWVYEAPPSPVYPSTPPQVVHIQEEVSHVAKTFEEMNVKELRAYCVEQGIKYGKLRKAELIELLNQRKK